MKMRSTILIGPDRGQNNLLLGYHIYSGNVQYQCSDIQNLLVFFWLFEYMECFRWDNNQTVGNASPYTGALNNYYCPPSHKQC